MPYVNKELKAEYQERTATPYMKEWREKNRDKQRKYMREWIKKRRANPEKREKDKQAPGMKWQHEMTVAKWRGWVVSMNDTYIRGLLTRRGTLSKEAITPEMILLHKKQLLIKRKLKQYGNISH